MSTNQRSLASALAIFLVAFTVRVGIASRFQGLASEPDALAQPDQIDYERLAWRLSQGLGYTTESGVPTASRPPGTSFTMLPVYNSFGRWYAAARVWFCLLSALTCAALLLLSAECFGLPTGVLAGLWLALYPGHFYYPLHFVSEVPYGLFLVAAMWLTLRALRPGSHPLIATAGAAALWALAILTRPQMLVAVPLVPAVSLLAAPGTRRKTFALLAAQTAVVFALLLPWVVRNAAAVGKPTLSTVGGPTFWGANNDLVSNEPALMGSWVRTSDLVDARHPMRGTELERESAAWSYGIDFVRANLRRMPVLEAAKVWRLVTPFETTTNGAVFWTFAVAWLLTAPWIPLGIRDAWKRNRTAAAILLVPVVATVTTALLFYGSVRFRDSIAPVLVLFASVSAANAIDWRLPRARWRRAAPVEPPRRAA